jgi:cell division transport system ATP-binding protein
MIELYNVTLSYGRRDVLNNITFRIRKSEFVYLIGPTGIGKSSILKLIYFQEFPDSGTVMVNQYNSNNIRIKDIPYLRRSLGIVFQDFKLLPDRNVFENIAFSLYVTGAKKKGIHKKVLRVLTEVGLGHRRNKYPNDLSGGEQQKTAIARALVNDPTILLADEPTGNLDPAAAEEVLILLERINQRGTAILMATHNYDIIKKYPHRVLVLDNGELKEE